MAHAEVCHIQGTDETHLTYLDFRKAELMVEPVERKYCKWFLHETFLNHITNIQDDKHNPIWRMPGRIDVYDVVESRLMPQLADIEADSVIAIFMNPKRIIHGNRKGIEIKRFDETTEGLEYGDLFMRFRKRDIYYLIPKTKVFLPLENGGENYKTEVKPNPRLRSTATAAYPCIWLNEGYNGLCPVLPMTRIYDSISI